MKYNLIYPLIVTIKATRQPKLTEKKFRGEGNSLKATSHQRKENYNGFLCFLEATWVFLDTDVTMSLSKKNPRCLMHQKVIMQRGGRAKTIVRIK